MLSDIYYLPHVYSKIMKLIHKITFICACMFHTTLSSCIQVNVLVHFCAVQKGEVLETITVKKLCTRENYLDFRKFFQILVS
jgi:hypothetical protein